MDERDGFVLEAKIARFGEKRTDFAKRQRVKAMDYQFFESRPILIIWPLWKGTLTTVPHVQGSCQLLV